MANTIVLGIRIKADGTAEIVRDLERTEDAVRDVGSAAQTAGTQATAGLGDVGRAARQADTLVGDLKGQLLSLVKQVAVFEALRRAASSFFSTSTEAESLQAMLRAVTGGADQAAQAFAALRQEAASSPAQLTELVSAYAQLTRRGLDASLEALRDYQAIAAGKLGATLDDAIQAVLDAAIGQGDERLSEFGIAWQKTGDQITLSMGDLTLKVSNNADEIVAALRRIAQEKFATSVTEQLGTMAQRLSNLGDAWDELMGAISETGAWDTLKGLISEVTGWLQGLARYVRILSRDFQMLGEIGQIMVSGPNAVAALDFGPSLSRAEAVLNAIERRNAAVQALEEAAAKPTALPDLPKTLGAAAEAHEGAAKGAKKHKDALEALNIPFKEYFRQASELSGVNVSLLAGIAKVESGFQADAVSRRGAVGVMQMMKAATQDVGAEWGKMREPQANIIAGAQYFALLMKQTGGNVREALSAYNQGLRNLQKYGVTNEKYIQDVLRWAEAYGDGKLKVDAMADAMKEHQRIAQETVLAMAELLKRQGEFLGGLQDAATQAQDELLKLQDPIAYQELMRARERAILDETAARLALNEAQTAAAKAALETKFANEDLADSYRKTEQAAAEALQVREGWAQSLLQGFDQLWSNMISGAENAMEALQQTLKSWLYAIGQWLLKQTLLIPITAGLFGVSQQSLGGGLLGSLTGGGGGGGLLGNLGNLFGGYGVAGGFQDLFQGIGELIGNDFLSTITVNAPNWMFGAAGALGGFAGQQLFGGYGGIGGALGGLGGTAIGSTIDALGWAGGPIGGLVGARLGGALGGMFGGGGPEVTGGGAFYSTKEGRARGVHSGTSPETIAAVAAWGKMAEQIKQTLEASGIKDFFADLFIDADSTGRIAAQLVVAGNVLRKEGFGSLEEATAWANEIMAPMVLLAETLAGLGDSANMTANQLFTISNAIAELAGGTEAYAQKAQTLLGLVAQSAAFQDEQIARAQNEINAYQAQYGVTLDSADAVYEYMKGLDLTTAAGQQAYAALLDVADALALVFRESTEGTAKVTAGIKDWLGLAQGVTELMRQVQFSQQSPLPASAQYQLLTQDIAQLEELFATLSGAEKLATGQELLSLYSQAFGMLPSAFGGSTSAYLKEWNRLAAALGELGLETRSELEVLVDMATVDQAMLDQLISIDAHLAAFLAGIPSHQGGLAYVPHDNYIARLHAGERVLTREEAARPAPARALTINIPITVPGASAAQSERIAQQLRPVVLAAVRQALPAINKMSRFS